MYVCLNVYRQHQVMHGQITIVDVGNTLTHVRGMNVFKRVCVSYLNKGKQAYFLVSIDSLLNMAECVVVILNAFS